MAWQFFAEIKLYHAAMLQQPRVPATGQRQAIEIQIKWREVLAQKEALLNILSRHTGHSKAKLDAVSAFPTPTVQSMKAMCLAALVLSPAGCL